MLSKTEINVLERVAKGNKEIINIAKALKKSDKQIYVTVKKLAEKGIVERIRGFIEPVKAIYITLLLQLLSEYSNLAPLLSGSGIHILTALLQPSSIKEIISKTGFKRAMVYRKLKEAKKRSIILKKDSKFQINNKIWPKLKEFLQELRKHEYITDERIPVSSVIYYKNKEEIIFSCKEECDAAKTAFSAYEEYGIKLMLTKNYYYLPKKKLTKKEILKHSLYIIEKEWSMRNLIFVALFYIKYKNELKIEHQILINIKKILSGGEIKGYPKYQEIKDRAEVYNIKI